MGKNTEGRILTLDHTVLMPQKTVALVTYISTKDITQSVPREIYT